MALFGATRHVAEVENINPRKEAQDVHPLEAQGPQGPQVMPDPGMPAPASPSPQGGPQQPPMGSSPATQPTQNRGQEMKGMQKLALLVGEMPGILADVGATSEAGQAITSALKLLAKHVPPGSSSPAGKRNEIQDMALKNTQNAAMMQQLQQRGAQGGAPQPQPGAPPMAA